MSNRKNSFHSNQSKSSESQEKQFNTLKSDLFQKSKIEKNEKSTLYIESNQPLNMANFSFEDFEAQPVFSEEIELLRKTELNEMKQLLKLRSNILFEQLNNISLIIPGHELISLEDRNSSSHRSLNNSEYNSFHYTNSGQEYSNHLKLDNISSNQNIESKNCDIDENNESNEINKTLDIDSPIKNVSLSPINHHNSNSLDFKMSPVVQENHEKIAFEKSANKISNYEVELNSNRQENELDNFQEYKYLLSLLTHPERMKLLESFSHIELDQHHSTMNNIRSTLKQQMQYNEKLWKENRLTGDEWDSNRMSRLELKRDKLLKEIALLKKQYHESEQIQL